MEIYIYSFKFYLIPFIRLHVNLSSITEGLPLQIVCDEGVIGKTIIVMRTMNQLD